MTVQPCVIAELLRFEGLHNSSYGGKLVWAVKVFVLSEIVLECKHS